MQKRTYKEKKEGRFYSSSPGNSRQSDERHGGNWLALFSLNSLLGPWGSVILPGQRVPYQAKPRILGMAFEPRGVREMPIRNAKYAPAGSYPAP